MVSRAAPAWVPGVQQASGHQQRAVVVQEASGKVVDPLPGELLDDDLPVRGKQVHGTRENAVQILCVVQGSREQHDFIHAGDVVDIAMDGHHSTFRGGQDRFGVAINAGHLYPKSTPAQRLKHRDRNPFQGFGLAQLEPATSDGSAYGARQRLSDPSC
jgi:hypothetical protein